MLTESDHNDFISAVYHLKTGTITFLSLLKMSLLFQIPPETMVTSHALCLSIYQTSLVSRAFYGLPVLQTHILHKQTHTDM